VAPRSRHRSARLRGRQGRQRKPGKKKVEFEATPKKKSAEIIADLQARLDKLEKGQPKKKIKNRVRPSWANVVGGAGLERGQRRYLSIWN
jgi:hypothetical protein